jgi:hypothetical protein
MHQIACLEPEIAPLPLAMTGRQAKVVGIAHLAPVMAVCRDGLLS